MGTSFIFVSMIYRLRPLLFFLFVSAFFITAASVLFYAYGYRFSLERGIFIYTGSLSLKTNLETVTIKVDNTPIPQKELGLLNNSIHIAGLSPGEHMIEVSSPGYRPWSKKVVIQSGITTEFWNIFLTQETYEQIEVPGTENVVEMFPALNGLMATVKKNGARYSVEVLNPEQEKHEEVFATTDAIFSPDSETNIEWSPESHKLIIPLLRNDQPLYAVVDIRSKESFFLNTVTGITTPLRAPRWDANSRDSLFFLDQNTLYRFNTNTPDQAPKLVASEVAAYDLSGNRLYYLHSVSGTIYEISSNGTDTTPEQITPSPLPLQSEGVYSLIAYDETRLAVIEEGSGRLFVYNQEAADNPLRELGQAIQSIQYSDDGKKLLFYTDHEISVYFNQDWEAQPVRGKDTIAQIARFSSPIKNVQWTKDYEHVIFSLGKSIKVIELDNRDRRDFVDLLTLDTPPLQILSRFGNNTLYVVPDPTLSSTGVFRILLSQDGGFFNF